MLTQFTYDFFAIFAIAFGFLSHNKIVENTLKTERSD